MKQNPFPQSFVMRQKHHSLSLGLAVGWSGFLSPHFFQISPKSLKFPLQSFHASLSYERVKPQCLAQSMGRGSASRKPQVEREPNREAANSIQDKLLPPYHAPLGLPIRCHQQGTKRGCVQRYSMFLCQGPEGSSCHLARLRIPGQNLNHQGSFAEPFVTGASVLRPWTTEVAEARRDIWGQGSPSTLTSFSAGPGQESRVCIWALELAMLGVEFLPCHLPAVRPRASYLFPWTPRLPFGEMELIVGTAVKTRAL